MSTIESSFLAPPELCDSDLDSFYVHRALPTRQKRMVGPWIFFDEMGPAQFQAGEGIIGDEDEFIPLP